MSLIENLTPEQEALIPVYRQKWRAIALSTERINRKKAAKSVNKAYALSDLAKPEIIFIDSPRTAISSSGFNVWIEPRGELDSYFEDVPHSRRKCCNCVITPLIPPCKGGKQEKSGSLPNASGRVRVG